MSFLRRTALQLRSVLGRGRLAREMDEEMRAHLELATDRYIARGLSPHDARAAARREFGNLPMIEDEAREARGARWLDALGGDLRFAFRYFARHKATTAIIIAVLALGAGANVLIFSFFQGEFLRPAPAVPVDAARANIWARERATPTARWQARAFTRTELAALAERRETFADVAGWMSDVAILRGDSSAALGVITQYVTPNYFQVLGVAPSGPGFRRGSVDEPDMVAVLSDATAQRLYGSARSAMGRQVLVNEVSVVVVGVAPPRFQGARRNMNEPALWLPLSARAVIARMSPRSLDDSPALSLVARLSSGASHGQATAIARQVVANALPDSAARVGMARTADVLPMRATPPGSNQADIVIAVTATIVLGWLILLVAWMNVSSLMVVAAVTRRHEIAVRLSLGASRRRLLRQLVTESTLLALVGAAIGMLIAWWLLLVAMKTEVDGLDLAPDAGTFAFTMALALATGILFGLSPALHATRGAVASAMRDSGSGISSRSRLQRGFVVAQIALSQPLLVLLGVVLSLVISDYRPLSAEMSGRVIGMDLRPLRDGAPGQRPEDVAALIPRIAEQAGVVNAVPASHAFALRRVVAGDRQAARAALDSAPRILTVEAAAPGWLELVDAPVILGRDVSLADSAAVDHPVVIGVDLARAFWGDESPIGRTLASPAMPGLGQDSIALTVIGVYDASRRLPGMSFGGHAVRGSMTEASTRVFTARGKLWRPDRVLVRTHGPAVPYVAELHRFMRERAPALAVASIRTLAQVDEEAYRVTLFSSALAGAGGALALLLASLGLSGVVSLAVRQRMREIGIRIAVGATPLSVARSFLLSGVRVGVVALVLGLPLSIAALKIGLTQGVVVAPKMNPWLIGMVIAPVLLGVAAAATWIPARRAALVDPATTLRTE